MKTSPIDEGLPIRTGEPDRVHPLDKAFADGGLVPGRITPLSGPPSHTPPGGTIPDENHHLEGFHRASGSWVKLAKFATADEAEEAIMLCHSRSQPDKKNVSIVWDDFSAFRSQLYVTVQIVSGRLV